MSGVPFTFQGSLSFPPDVGVPPEPIPINFAGNYKQIASSIQQLVGAGTKVIDFGSIGSPGALLVVVKVDATNAPPATPPGPVNLQWNGGGSSGEQEISPGGFLVIGSGAPSAGLIALSVIYTTNVTVRVWVLG